MNPAICGIFDRPVLYSNFCKRFRATSEDHAIYFDRFLMEMRQSGEIWDFINGTSLPNLDSDGLLTGKRAVVPCDRLLAAYADLIRPHYARLYSCESRTLAALRDTLLPKLLSGEVRVPEAEEASETVNG